MSPVRVLALVAAAAMLWVAVVSIMAAPGVVIAYGVGALLLLVVPALVAAGWLYLRVGRGARS